MQLFESTLINIRKIQLTWEVKNLGLLNLFYLFAFVVASFFAYHLSQTPLHAFLVICFLWLSILSFHFSRRDLPFIKQHIEKPSLSIFWEYFSLFTIFTIPIFFTAQWYFVFLFWLGLIPISLIKPGLKQKTFLAKLNRYISPKYFEAISGLRKTFIPAIGLYLLTWSICWVRGIPLFFIWFITVIVTSYFSHSEPLHILRQTPHKPKMFLWKKVWDYGKVLFLLYAPICFVNYLFHPELWYLNLSILPMQVGLVAVVIFFKYAYYFPNMPLKQNEVVIGINTLSALVTFLFPIPLIFGFIYYFKAKRNLKYFLHD